MLDATPGTWDDISWRHQPHTLVTRSICHSEPLNRQHLAVTDPDDAAACVRVPPTTSHMQCCMFQLSMPPSPCMPWACLPVVQIRVATQDLEPFPPRHMLACYPTAPSTQAHKHGPVKPQAAPSRSRQAHVRGQWRRRLGPLPFPQRVIVGSAADYSGLCFPPCSPHLGLEAAHPSCPLGLAP